MSSNTKVEESFYFQFLVDRKYVKAGTKFRDATDLSSKYGVLQTLKEIRYIIIKRLHYPLFVGIISRDAVIRIGDLDCF